MAIVSSAFLDFLNPWILEFGLHYGVVSKCLGWLRCL
jgi:hypothetical protein